MKPAEQNHVPLPDDRVRMTGLMPGDPAPLPIGTAGTVREARPEVNQIYVTWDNGSSLILLTTDPFEIITTNPDKD